MVQLTGLIDIQNLEKTIEKSKEQRIIKIAERETITKQEKEQIIAIIKN